MKRIIILLPLLITNLAFAGGDLIVNGKIGVGTANPQATLEVTSGLINSITSSSWRGAAVLGRTGKGTSIIDSSYIPSWAMVGGAFISSYLGQNYTNIGVVGIAQSTNGYSGTIGGLFDAYNDGTTGDTIGVRIKYVSGGAAQYGIYQDQAAINNFFNGNVGIGTTSPAYTLDVNGTIRGNNVSPSDIRLKENIAPVEAALVKVQALKGMTYTWKKTYDNRKFSEGRHYGVIAQEVEKVLPEVVKTDSKGEKSVAYTEIIPVLIEAIKEQQEIIKKQDKRLAELEKALLPKK